MAQLPTIEILSKPSSSTQLLPIAPYPTEIALDPPTTEETHVRNNNRRSKRINNNTTTTTNNNNNKKAISKEETTSRRRPPPTNKPKKSSKSKPSTSPPIISSSNSIIEPSERALLTDYFHGIFQQLQICHFSETDRKTRGGKRDNITLGFGGLECRHCAAAHHHQHPHSKTNGRKFFWGNADRLANSFAEIPNHLLNCRNCDPAVKSRLLQLKQSHARQMGTMARGTQKMFFRRLWSRMQGATAAAGGDDDDVGDGYGDGRETRDGEGLSLAISEDALWLSPADVSLRRSLELFPAAKDVVTKKGGKNNGAAFEGQIGLRCAACATATTVVRKSDPSSRLAFPSCIARIFDDSREILRRHVRHCPCIPNAKKLELRSLDCSSTALRRYYIIAARAIGLVDTPDGIRLGDPGMPIGPPPAKINWLDTPQDIQTTTTTQRQPRQSAVSNAGNQTNMTLIPIQPKPTTTVPINHSSPPCPNATSLATTTTVILHPSAAAAPSPSAAGLVPILPKPNNNKNTSSSLRPIMTPTPKKQRIENPLTDVNTFHASLMAMGPTPSSRHPPQALLLPSSLPPLMVPQATTTFVMPTFATTTTQNNMTLTLCPLMPKQPPAPFITPYNTIHTNDDTVTSSSSSPSNNNNATAIRPMGPIDVGGGKTHDDGDNVALGSSSSCDSFRQTPGYIPIMPRPDANTKQLIGGFF